MELFGLTISNSALAVIFVALILFGTLVNMVGSLTKK